MSAALVVRADRRDRWRGARQRRRSSQKPAARTCACLPRDAKWPLGRPSGLAGLRAGAAGAPVTRLPEADGCRSTVARDAHPAAYKGVPGHGCQGLSGRFPGSTQRADLRRSGRVQRHRWWILAHSASAFGRTDRSRGVRAERVAACGGRAGADARFAVTRPAFNNARFTPAPIARFQRMSSRYARPADAPGGRDGRPAPDLRHTRNGNSGASERGLVIGAPVGNTPAAGPSAAQGPASR